MDALTLGLAGEEVVTGRELASGLVVNLDDQDGAVAVEVLNALSLIGRRGLREWVIKRRISHPSRGPGACRVAAGGLRQGR